MRRMSIIILTLTSAIILSLMFSNPVAAQSANKCSACHGAYYQYLDLKEGDASNILPVSLAVGATKTVAVVVSNTVSGTNPTQYTLSSVTVTLTSQNGHFSVSSPTYSVGTISPGGKKTATWTITGTSAGSDSLKITASAKNSHKSLSFTDAYSASPSINVGAAPPPPPPPPPTTPPTVTVTSPNGGESWNMGSSHSITWSATGGTGTLTTKLEYSLAGSSGPWTNIATGLPNNGVYSWSISSTIASSSNVFIRATVIDSASPALTASDTSNAAFTITTASPSPSPIPVPSPSPQPPAPSTPPLTTPPIDDAPIIIPKSPAIVFSVIEQLVVANRTMTFSTTGTFDPGNNTLLYKWDFGDGTPILEARQSIQTHIYQLPGVYSAILTVSNGETEVSQTMEIFVALLTQRSYDWHFVWVGMGITIFGSFGVAYSALRRDERGSSRHPANPKPRSGTLSTFFNLDPLKCVGCGFCSKRCTGMALTLVEKKPVHNSSKCHRCLACMNLCPRGAISLYLQERN